MSSEYTSSIISKYGDTDNVRTDVKTLVEIFKRQGSGLLIDVIAEQIGETVLKFNLNQSEARLILDTLLTDLKDAVLERT